MALHAKAKTKTWRLNSLKEKGPTGVGNNPVQALKEPLKAFISNRNSAVSPPLHQKISPLLQTTLDPMDRGAWQATVHPVVNQSDMT